MLLLQTILSYTVLGICQFITWTGVIYFMHRIAHVVPWMWYFHKDHHEFVDNNPTKIKWQPWNIFICMDSWKSTLDVWLTEVLPTAAFCSVFGCWWILIIYWLWAAGLQEDYEHNPDLNLMPWFTAGQWHLLHHKFPNRNYGLFVWWWDFVFGTYKYVGEEQLDNY